MYIALFVVEWYTLNTALDASSIGTLYNTTSYDFSNIVGPLQLIFSYSSLNHSLMPNSNIKQICQGVIFFLFIYYF